MAKTIAEKSIELAELNAGLLAKVSGLESEKAALIAQVEALKSESAANAAKIVEITATAEKAAADLVAVSTEKTALAAKVDELTKTLALHPEVRQSDGQKAVAGGDVSANVDGPTTWAGAMAACGGDYVKARTRFPEIHKAYLASAKGKQGA